MAALCGCTAPNVSFESAKQINQKPDAQHETLVWRSSTVFDVANRQPSGMNAASIEP